MSASMVIMQKRDDSALMKLWRREDRACYWTTDQQRYRPRRFVLQRQCRDIKTMFIVISVRFFATKWKHSGCCMWVNCFS